MNGLKLREVGKRSKPIAPRNVAAYRSLAAKVDLNNKAEVDLGRYLLNFASWLESPEYREQVNKRLARKAKYQK